MSKVLLLTGPGGAGKSTIANLIAKRCDYAYIDGDFEDTEFFPSDLFPEGEQWLEKNAKRLRQAHLKIINMAKALHDKNKDVVVDYIIFGFYLEFINSFQKEFGKDFEIKVLFPAKEEIIKRNNERDCWTIAVDRIEAVHSELKSIKGEIGEENFLNTAGQTPEETFKCYFADCGSKSDITKQQQD